MISLLVVRSHQKSIQVFFESKSALYTGSVFSLDCHRNCLDYVIEIRAPRGFRVATIRPGGYGAKCFCIVPVLIKF